MQNFFSGLVSKKLVLLELRVQLRLLLSDSAMPACCVQAEDAGLSLCLGYRNFQERIVVQKKKKETS